MKYFPEESLHQNLLCGTGEVEVAADLIALELGSLDTKVGAHGERKKKTWMALLSSSQLTSREA